MIAVMLLLAAAPAEPRDCDHASTQLELNMCANGAFEAADAEMNAQWKLTAAYMKQRDGQLDRASDKRPGYFDTLLAGQRAWLTYRDQHCLVEGFGARGGSMEPMLISGCKAELTRARTRQLKSLVETGN